MWLMHSGTPDQVFIRVRQHLNQFFGEKFVGRSGPLSCPSRKTDLKVIDFFVGDILKV
jgi:hypothetical protein